MAFLGLSRCSLMLLMAAKDYHHSVSRMVPRVLKRLSRLAERVCWVKSEGVKVRSAKLTIM